MAHLYRDLSVQSLYADLKAGYTLKQWQDKIERSTTLYIGNLDTETTDYQLHALFGRVGEVKRIIMGKIATIRRRHAASASLSTYGAQTRRTRYASLTE